MSNRDALAEMGQRLLLAEKEIRNLHGELVRAKRRLVSAEKVVDEIRRSHHGHIGDIEHCSYEACALVGEYDKAIREGR